MNEVIRVDESQSQALIEAATAADRSVYAFITQDVQTGHVSIQHKINHLKHTTGSNQMR